MLIYENCDKRRWFVICSLWFVYCSPVFQKIHLHFSSHHLSLLLSSFLPYFSHTVSLSLFSNCIWCIECMRPSHTCSLTFSYTHTYLVTHVSARAKRNVIGLPPGALCKFAHARSYCRRPSHTFPGARLCVRPLFHRQIPKGLSSVPVRRNTAVGTRTAHWTNIAFRTFAPSLEKSPFTTANPSCSYVRSDSRDFRSTYEFGAGTLAD